MQLITPKVFSVLFLSDKDIIFIFPKLLGGLTEKEPDGDGTVSVEILQISSSMWHKMPALPHPMYGGVC